MPQPSTVFSSGAKPQRGFIPHWKSVAANPKGADFEFGKLITGIPKVVFSSTLGKSEWPDAMVANGEIADSVNQLKMQMDKGQLVYRRKQFRCDRAQPR
jgi:hypothetical protein